MGRRRYDCSLRCTHRRLHARRRCRDNRVWSAQQRPNMSRFVGHKAGNRPVGWRQDGKRSGRPGRRRPDVRRQRTTQSRRRISPRHDGRQPRRPPGLLGASGATRFSRASSPRWTPSSRNWPMARKRRPHQSTDPFYSVIPFDPLCGATTSESGAAYATGQVTAVAHELIESTTNAFLTRGWTR